MKWVEDFYTKQDEWAGVYREPVDAFHRERAALIEVPGETRALRVLDLGCGGRQVACAIADRGHSVVAIDSNPRAIEQARPLAPARTDGRMRVIQGDFYTIDLDGRFDIVCHFDGFGVGEDADQQRLLNRIFSWLAPDGRAVVEIYTPWYWSKVAGRTINWGGVARRYDYDPDSNRMLDTWWPTDRPWAAVTQSLRCYAPDELRHPLEASGLELVHILPGGAYDHDAGIYRESVPIEEAMQYIATLRPIRDSGVDSDQSPA